jgi:hypothetical protein
MNDLIENVKIRAKSVSTVKTFICARRGRGAVAPARRHGVPKAEPVSDEHLSTTSAYGPRLQDAQQKTSARHRLKKA